MKDYTSNNQVGNRKKKKKRQTIEILKEVKWNMTRRGLEEEDSSNRDELSRKIK